MKKTKTAIIQRAYTLNIKYDNINKVTNHDIDVIKQYYPQRDWDNMLKLLPNRTKGAIQQIAWNNKISVNYRGWTKQQTETIKQEYEQLGGKKLIEKYPNLFEGKTSGTLNTYAKSLGLTVNRSKPIICVETNTIYKSIHDGAQSINKTPGLIVIALKDANKTAGGYHWKYVEEEKE